jgi:hypothetical protein
MKLSWESALKDAKSWIAMLGSKGLIAFFWQKYEKKNYVRQLHGKKLRKEREKNEKGYGKMTLREGKGNERDRRTYKERDREIGDPFIVPWVFIHQVSLRRKGHKKMCADKNTGREGWCGCTRCRRPKRPTIALKYTQSSVGKARQVQEEVGVSRVCARAVPCPSPLPRPSAFEWHSRYASLAWQCLYSLRIEVIHPYQ